MNLSTISEFLTSNWYMILAGFALAAFLLALIIRFLRSPKGSQLSKIKEWLIWACIEAEHELKSGTGKAKLAKVYNAFLSIPSFSWVSKVLPMANFSLLVDEALDVVKQMIVDNEDLAKYVYSSKTYKSETAKLIDQLSTKTEEVPNEQETTV